MKQERNAFQTDVLRAPERKRILNQALDARTLAEINAAQNELRHWVRSHPEDVGIREAFGGLSLLEDIAREQEAERNQAQEVLVPVERVA